jgi:hypothetical protein
LIAFQDASSVEDRNNAPERRVVKCPETFFTLFEVIDENLISEFIIQHEAPSVIDARTLTSSWLRSAISDFLRSEMSLININREGLGSSC